MAENKLEGFEDFDTGAGGAAKPSAAAGELDELLGKGEPAGGGEGGDSELDSFFEDLSTIDDLEVAQEQPKPEAAAPAAPAPAAAAAAAPKAQAAAPAPRAPRAPRAPSQPGRMRKMLLQLALLAVFGAAGYYFYVTYIAGEGQIPWPVFKAQPRVALPRVEEPAPPPPRPEAPARPLRVTPRFTGPGFGIQVATCFFESCVGAYKGLLSEAHLSVRIKERRSQSESLEVYTQTAFASRQVAQEAAERVNLENRLEGNAYVVEEGGSFRLSMGAFQDLGRANAVKDNLNQRYGGQIVFAHRLKSVPYVLKVLSTGVYPTRAAAEQAVEKLRAMDRSLAGVFVIPNEK
jgi:hypothetical protein